jgi:hypothetical protein
MTPLDEACAAVAAYQRRKQETIERMAAVLILRRLVRAYRTDRVEAYLAAGLTNEDVRSWDHHALQLAADVIEKTRVAA